MSTFLQFPSDEEWNRIQEDSILSQFRELIENYVNGDKEYDEHSFLHAISASEWYYELTRRFYTIQRTYIFARYYFDKGIPDDTWYLSPSRTGHTIEYFPEFSEGDFIKKSWFDYFVDIFYFKIFSFLDMLGHILKCEYDIQIHNRSISFEKILSHLKSKNSVLYENISSLVNSSAFQKAKLIRNNIVHNAAPHSTGMTVKRDGGKVLMGFKEYVQSKQIMDNINNILTISFDAFRYVMLSN